MFIGDLIRYIEIFIKNIWRLEIGYWEEKIEEELLLEEVELLKKK